MFGKITIYLAFSSALVSTILYFISAAKPNKVKPALGRIFFYITAGTVITSSIYLLANILSHNFQFTYIWEYSSKELPNNFLTATFYAGQQGSFMLWALILSIIGLFLSNSTRKYGYESLAMGFYTSIILFVAAILIFKSPFDYVWETFTKEGLQAGFMPDNGRGLNPILQNYWIQIHPPILFTGYSLLAAPFSIALAGLVKRDYKGWTKVVTSWTLIASGVLGLGIMLGGFWAYETLGWGGFWAWDPVENSSLIPWLVAVSFVHTLIIQRKTGGLVKTNFILAILTFTFVIYATFLTRSGILGDTSVHSFVEPGAIVYNMLIAFQVVYLALAAIIFIMRYRDMNRALSKSETKPQSKEFTTTLGSIFLLALTLIVLLGTSWPAIAELIGRPKVAVDTSVYNRFGSVMAVLILLLNGISIYQRWMSKSMKDIGKRLMLPALLTVISTIFFFIMGVHEPKYLFLSIAAFFALYTNLDFIIRKVVQKPRSLGAYSAHLGVALLIFGIIGSAGFAITEQMRLKEGDTSHALGYKFTFDSKERIEQHYSDREKYKYHITVEKDGKTEVLKPVIYWSNFNNWQSPFLEPGIKTYANKDIYLSPKAVETSLDIPYMSMQKGEMSPVPYDSSTTFTVAGFLMGSNSTEMAPNKILYKTVINFSGNGINQVDTLKTILDADTWDGDPVWKHVEGTDYEMAMIKLIKSPDNDIQKTKALIIFNKVGQALPQPKEIITFDVTIKPYINFVWIGTLIIVAGFFITLSKYNKLRKEDNSVKQKAEKIVNYENESITV